MRSASGSEGAEGRASRLKIVAEMALSAAESNDRTDGGASAPAVDAAPQGPAAVPTDGPPNWGSRFHLESTWGRVKAWSNMFFVDHGFFRYAYLNLHKIDASAYRSAQPGPRHFRRIAKKGVRTVVNLRGGRHFGSYPLEREACHHHGLAYEEVTLRSREAPRREALRAVAALLERIEYPALFHCKSGADRAGLMSALYLLLKAGRSATEAKAMLALRYGHVRQSKTGVLDAFLDAFEAAQRAAESEGRSLDLMTWVEGDYDPVALTKSFRTKPWANWLIDDVLRRE